MIVCNPRTLPEIYNNPKKSDFVDAETLARIGHTDASKLQTLVDFTLIRRSRGAAQEAKPLASA